MGTDRPLFRRKKCFFFSTAEKKKKKKKNLFFEKKFKFQKNFQKFSKIFRNFFQIFFFIFWINSFCFFFFRETEKKKHSQKPIEVGAARGRGMMGPPESEDERNHSRECSLFNNGMCWVGKCFWGTGRVFFLVFILSTQIIKHPHRRGGRIRSVIKNNTISILVVQNKMC